MVEGVFHGEAQGPHGVRKGRLSRLDAILRAFLPIAPFAGQLEELVDPQGEDPDLPERQRHPAGDIDAQVGIGKEPRRDFQPFGGIDPIPGHEQIQVLFEKERHRLVHGQAEGISASRRLERRLRAEGRAAQQSRRDRRAAKPGP